MMSTFANSLQKPERFDLYVRKFRATCVMHGIQTGSRTDLPAFLQRLMGDQHFAMDFWRLIGKLSNREGGELTDDQVLAVVVEGVTDGEIPEEDTELKRTVSDLRAMLAGVDVHTQVEVAPFPRIDASPQLAEGEWRTRALDLPLTPPDSRAAFTPEPAEEETKNEVPPVAPPQQEDEALQRLELTKLVEQYFGTIDTSEPASPEEALPPETVTTQIAPPLLDPPLDPPLLEESSPEPTEEPILKPIGSARLVLEAVTPTTEDSVAGKSDDSSIRIPLQSYSTAEDDGGTPGYGKPALYLLLVLALSGAGIAAYKYRAPLQRKKNALIQGIHQKTGTDTSANQTAPPPAASEEKPLALQPEQSQQPAEPPLPVDSTSPTTPPTDNAQPSTAPVGSQPVVGEGNSAGSSSRKAATDHVAVQAEPIQPSTISNADLAGAIRVSPAVMEANLVVSRVPAYPENAKISGVEGSVVMQAIISKDGTVKRVHVTQGDSRLRSAAIEAAYKWRYRPYLLNGQPMDVVTTITVNFDLDR